MLRVFLHIARVFGIGFFALFVLMALLAFAFRDLAGGPNQGVSVFGGLLMSGTILLIGVLGLLVARAAHQELHRKPEARGFPVTMPVAPRPQGTSDE